MSEQQIVFVTGGASGIGLAIVEAAIAAGWVAVVTDVNQENLNRTKQQFDEKIKTVLLNISSEEQVIRAINICEQEYGPIAAVVNSAGIGKDVSALQTEVDLFNHILAVNLIGTFLVAREAAKRMKLRGGGSIVNIASVSGMLGNTGRTAYGASKGGVLAMTRIMAVEWAPYRIRVNAIAPGPIDTPLAQAVHTEVVRDAWNKAVPLHRYGTAAEIASAVLFMMDNEQSSYITGQTLCVDGGFSVAGLMSEATAIDSSR
jgi:NAD(P)-dependent dehydrogenase (short-subunit alcohol dehydrogenase family)